MSGRSASAARPVAPDATRIARRLRESLGPDLVAVVFFGSRYLGTSPNATSACDLFVVVEDYLRFYRSRPREISGARGPRALARLNSVLPPNILSFPASGDDAGAKLFIISRVHFARALARRSPDHFVKGRLTQDVVVLDARGETERRWAEGLLDEARRSALDWVPAFLAPAREGRAFDVEDFCRRMLEVSYAHEIRPEPAARVREVHDAQRAFFALIYGEILEAAARDGRLQKEDVADGGLEREGAKFRAVETQSALQRLRWAAYFRRSKSRATLRWLKYTMTYDDWLDYLVRKVERRTGMAVEITPLERRLPFLLLWPKVIRVLRKRKADGADSTSATIDRSGRG